MWQNRINQARKHDRFTKKDKRDAGMYNYGPLSERPEAQDMVLFDNFLTPEVKWKAMSFALFVENNNFDRAEQCLKDIQRMRVVKMICRQRINVAKKNGYFTNEDMETLRMTPYGPLSDRPEFSNRRMLYADVMKVHSDILYKHFEFVEYVKNNNVLKAEDCYEDIIYAGNILK